MFREGTAAMAGTTNLKSLLWFVLFEFLSLGCWLNLGRQNASAQILPDNTLGAESSRITNVSDIRELIEGGAIRGSHLFHSFEAFNVGEGQEAYFANPVGIESIFSRVTGNNPSAILGTLGVDGAANLFFLNPNGIIFGEKAQLDIRGSFVASTANRLVFDNGVEFSATNPESAPLLTINLTPGLQYGANPPPQSSIERGKIITANATRLAVGGNLTLAANDLDLQGNLYAGNNLKIVAQDTVRIRDSVVNSFIAQAQGDLLIQGNQNVDIFALNHPDSGLFSGGEMVLRSANTVGGDIHYWSGGSFRIEKLDGSLGNLYSPNDPIIRANGDVFLASYTGASLHILAGGSVTIPGIVKITSPQMVGTSGVDYIAEEVQLSDGTSVHIDGSTKPTLDVRAGVDPTQINVSGVASSGFLPPPLITRTPTSADIKIGIAILDSTTPDGVVFLTNQYQPNTALTGGTIEFGAIFAADQINQESLYFDLRHSNGFINLDPFSGNGGSVVIDSRGNITSNQSRLNGLNVSFIIASSASGASGDITFIANDTIHLVDSFILSDTANPNKGGDINLTARSISFTNTRLATFTSGFGKGQGGNLTVNVSDSVNLFNRSALTANTDGAGNAGHITVNTSKLIIQNDQYKFESETGISTGALVNSSGQGGNLTVNASEFIKLIGNEPGSFPVNPNPATIQELSLLSVGIATTTEGPGDAGTLTLNTKQLITQDGAGVATVARRDSRGGNGGRLTINANQVWLQGKGGVGSASVGPGNAGELFLNAEQVTVTDGATITADTIGLGDASNLTINTKELLIDNGRVGAATLDLPQPGRAGNLTVNATESLQIRNSGVLSVQASAGGIAGNLTVKTKQLMVEDGSSVTASSPQGQAGNINIDAHRIDLNSGTISAETGVNAGREQEAANINLDRVEFLFIQDDSLIAAQANIQANGGNININAEDGFIIANSSANSDIIATAVEGNGGNIQISAHRIFGLEEQSGSFDSLRSNDTNDISASSEFGTDGAITIDDLEIDPVQGAVELPTDTESPPLTQGCQPGEDGRGRFVNTERGGIPPSPSDPISSSVGWEDVQPATSEEQESEKTTAPKVIVEAQGWYVNERGEVILYANRPSTSRVFTCQ